MTAIHPMTREYAEYLHDESRSVGSADSISFPADEDGIRSVLRALRTRPDGSAAAPPPVTVQGARTGLAAGRVAAQASTRSRAAATS